MPQLPEFQQDPATLPNRPMPDPISPNEVGEGGRALSAMGGELANVAATVAEKRKQASDSDYALSQAMKDSRDLEQLKTQLQKDTSITADGYAQTVKQWSEDRFKQGQEAAPSETAKQLYLHATAHLFNQAGIDADIFENKQRAIGYSKNLADQVQMSTSHIIDNPNPDFTRDQIDFVRKLIQSQTGSVYTAEQAHDLLKEHTNSLTRAMFDGLYANGIGDPAAGKAYLQKGLKLLKGDDAYDLQNGAQIGVPSLSDNLSREEKAAYIDRFERALKTTSKIGLAELHRRIEDNKAAALGNKGVDPTLGPAINDAISNGQMTKEEGVRHFDDLVTAKAAGQIIDKLRTTNPSEWPSFIDSFKNDVAEVQDQFAKANPELAAINAKNYNEAQRSKIANMVMGAMDTEATARQKDPTGYAQQNFPLVDRLHRMSAGGDPAATQQYISTLLNTEDTLGVLPENKRILSKSDSYKISSDIQNGDERQISNNFSRYEQQYGRYFPQMFTEMVKDGQIDAKYWWASWVKDQAPRDRMISNIKNGSAIDDGFKKLKSPEEERELSTEVRSRAGDYYTSFAQKNANGGTLKQANAFYELVELEAKKQILTNPKMSPKDAATQALRVVSDPFGLSTAGGSNTVYPREVEGVPINGKLLDAFKTSHLKRDTFDEMGIGVPENNAFGGFIPLDTKDKMKEQYYTAIEKYGFWTTTESGDGIQLKVKLPNMTQPYPVFTSKDRSPVIYKFKDITQKADKPTLDEAGKSWWQKIF